MNRDTLLIRKLQIETERLNRELQAATESRDKYKAALIIWGATDAELEAITNDSIYRLQMYAENFRALHIWQMNERTQLLFDDIKKYRIEEAELREEFRSMKADGLPHKYLYELWEQAHKK